MSKADWMVLENIKKGAFLPGFKITYPWSPTYPISPPSGNFPVILPKNSWVEACLQQHEISLVVHTGLKDERTPLPLQFYNHNLFFPSNETLSCSVCELPVAQQLCWVCSRHRRGEINQIGTRADTHSSAFLSFLCICSLQTLNYPVEYIAKNRWVNIWLVLGADKKHLFIMKKSSAFQLSQSKPQTFCKQ